MVQSIIHIALVVKDYDAAIEFGMVAVFKDLYGNLWDLLQLKEDHPIFKRIK
ncbi:MAG: hypothetical protein ACREV6_20935 [Clostridium sp.]|uniref:hypothetical protein n=1 Tax=Clostridium sp. TaxID=1506 RepID=UPI003D6CD26C